MKTQYYIERRNAGKLLLALLLLVTILLLYSTQGQLIQFKQTLKVNKKVKDDKSIAAPNIICVRFVAGLGNNIFQFASAFGLSHLKGYPLIISNSSRVAKIFQINVTFKNVDHYCKHLPVKKERNELFATFDKDMIDFNMTGDTRVGSYLQSWKYFECCRDLLRQQLVFKKHIRDRVEKIKRSILQHDPRSPLTLVGVHVRRGDMVNNKLGFKVATAEYINKAVRFYQHRFENVLFIVSSNDIAWCKTHMPGNASFVYIDNNPETDMAVLANCDHTIMTVGTFGWWCAWLAGGNVTYFKHPAVNGSWWHKKISITDHFPPNWIGL